MESVKLQLRRSIWTAKRRPGEEKLHRGAADDEANHHSTPTATLELRAIVKGVGSARDHDVAAHGIGTSERARVGRRQNNPIRRDGRGGNRCCAGRRRRTAGATTGSGAHSTQSTSGRRLRERALRRGAQYGRKGIVCYTRFRRARRDKGLTKHSRGEGEDL